MLLFGLVHNNPEFLQTVCSRWEQMPAAKQRKILAGKDIIFGSEVSGGGRDQTDVLSSAHLHVAFSGEINHCSVPDVVGRGCDLFAKLYSRYGSGSISKTSGHFSAAVWDKGGQELRLFVDRTGGIKTLYYTRLPGGFAFCSSLGILSSVLGLRKEINDSVICELFATGYILPPQTLWKGVNKICPGEEVRYHKGEVTRRRVDTICFHSSAAVESTRDELENRLANALARLTEEPETGFLLSGGIDSSILVALASQRLKKHISAYSAAFPGSLFDESSFAQVVAQANNCSLEFVDLSQTHALDDLPEIIWNLGEPFLDFSAIPTFQLFRKVRQKTSIVVCGDGPDHLFARYYPLAAKRYVGMRYRDAIAYLCKLPLAFPKKILRAAEVSQYESYRGLFSIPAWGEKANTTLAGLLKIPLPGEYDASAFFEGIEIPPESDFAGYMDAIATMDFYIDGACGVFAKVGRMADAHGLILREPYLDRDVSDLIASLPLQEKQRGTLVHLLASRTKNKWLLKYGIGSRLLPSEIIYKKKGGFTPPLGHWLREVVCPVPVPRLLSSTTMDLNIFNTNVFEMILQQHKLGIFDWSRVIFLVISFDLWIRIFLENEQGSFSWKKLHEYYGQ